MSAILERPEIEKINGTTFYHLRDRHGLSQLEKFSKEHSLFDSLILEELNLAIADYNATSAENANLLPALCRLKNKIPSLPSLSELTEENQIAAAASLNTAMANGERKKAGAELPPNEQSLSWFLTPTHALALNAGLRFHWYEETVIQNPGLTRGQKIELDEVVDVLIEMLIVNHPDSLLCRLVKRPVFLGPSGGLDWINGYDKLSQEVRHLAGCD